jgi:RNA polymerase sigma factor (sigma-70 family)
VRHNGLCGETCAIEDSAVYTMEILRSMTIKSKSADFLSHEDINQLYHAYHRDLAAYARAILGNHHDAEEAVHDVFCSFYEKTSGETSGIKNSSPRALLFVSVRNRSYDILRKKSREIASEDIRTVVDDFTEKTDLQIVINEVYEYVRNHSTPVSREVFFLRVVHCLSWQEVSDVTGLPISTVHRNFEHLTEDITKRFPGILD